MLYCKCCHKYLDDSEFSKLKRGLSKNQYNNNGNYKSCSYCRKEKRIYNKIRKNKMEKLKGSSINPDLIDMKNNDLSYTLMSDDIIKCLPESLKDIKIYKYNEIDKFNDINGLLYPTDCCVILYVTENVDNNYMGHWTCLLKTVDDENNNSINFFDSYGMIPDTEKKYIDKRYLELSDQKENTLTQLLYNEHLNDSSIEYNEKRLQKMNPDINTCGKHILFRLWLKELSMNNFQKFIEKLKKQFKLDYDDLVNKFVNFVLVEDNQPENIIELLYEL